jgi:hypothetical protein
VRTVTLAGEPFAIDATERDGAWTATARRAGTGERVGPGVKGATEREAIELASAWLEWQHEHVAALEALQDAERAYQRAVAGSSLAAGVDGLLPIEVQKEALSRLEDARLRLDEVRQRRPGI